MNNFFMTDLEQTLAGEERETCIKHLQAAFDQEINQFKAALRRPSTTQEFNRNNACLDVFSNGLTVLNTITE
ncbi:EscE/YscE/SsaE family type III secretion system needle protein co-chaperone [Thalassomonas sp. RHCl1]|uniref:EscE/YscE/SsaE family type III secretion system needle protein co-chaperone n=1 Tax=Thalassomonas sp. RHCl1 TaxID=2995320 RepID=UPI00248B186F|nr:EscE/YscE/SsaE family type III secretion system needle protein co-chaperone [Thalassomonas sp. RHCl1]